MIVHMAARQITVDSSLATHLPLCHVEGCGWRGPVLRDKGKAHAYADAHRDVEHPELAAEAAKKRRQREAA
jgi:hypothetical protein